MGIWVLTIIILTGANKVCAQVTYRVIDNNLNNIKNTHVTFSPVLGRWQGAVPIDHIPGFAAGISHRMGRLGSAELYYQKQFDLGATNGLLNTNYHRFGGLATYTFESIVDFTDKRIQLKDENIKTPYVKIHGRYLKQVEGRLGYEGGKVPIDAEGVVLMRTGVIRAGFQFIKTDRLKAMSKLGLKRYLKQKSYYADLLYAPFLRPGETATPDAYDKVRYGLVGGVQMRNLRTVAPTWNIEFGIYPTLLNDAGEMQALYVQVKYSIPVVNLKLPTPKELEYQLD